MANAPSQAAVVPVTPRPGQLVLEDINEDGSPLHARPVPRTVDRAQETSTSSESCKKPRFSFFSWLSERCSGSKSDKEAHLVPTPAKNGQISEPILSKRRIRYEWLNWFVWTAFTIWWILDRFTTQVTPRQDFSLGGKTVASDPTDIKEGPWTVKFYDVFARVSGRFLTPAVNVLLFTRMHTLMYALREGSFHTCFVDMGRSDRHNDLMHNSWGILVCVCTLVHVWSILMPPVFNDFSVVVKAGTFEWPVSERKPSGFSDIKTAEKLVMLQVDDVWRLAEMTILLGILMPYSYRWLSSRYHLGIVVHNFISAM